jgi:hypothetical protein
MTRRFRQILTPLLAILGVQAWLLILHGFWGPNIHVKLLLAAAIAGAIPPVNWVVWRLLRKFRRPTPKIRAAITVAVTLAAGVAMGRYAITSHRDLFPTMHDEFQFLLQTRMVASGHLWMPAHPLLDFFDTFYVLIQPKYAAQSFPGTAILFAPSIWLGIAPWKWAIGLAAIVVGLMYRVTAELLDGLAGLLAAAMLSVLSLLRYVSTMVLAQTPVMLLGLATIWAYLHWRRKHSIPWAAAMGFIGGLTLMTRPADALIFGLPVAVAVLLDLKRNEILKTLATAFVAAGPWIALQLIVNFGITGHWLTTPFSLYNQRDQPRLAFGLRAPETGPPPMTHIPEKRQYYREGVIYRLNEHKPSRFWHSFASERFPVTIENDLPQPMLIALMPIGLLAWGKRRAWILASGLPLFFLLYTPYPLFTTHYTVVAAPAVIFSIVLAPVAVGLACPAARPAVWTAFSIFVVGLLFTPLVDGASMTGAMAFHNVVLRSANEKLANLAARGRPAVVLFRRDPHLSAEVEPVYNLQTAWPDDAIVIRAHDRRRENRQIFQYYATHGPDRAFYRFEESRPLDPLVYLGMSSELAKTSVGH